MRRLLEKVLPSLRSAPEPHRPARPTGGHRVYVRIDEPLMAEKRLRKYQKPLHEALLLAHVGHVTGGGSVQGTDGTIQWVSIELSLGDLDGALHFACAKLRELGASARSTVRFKQGGTEVVQTIC